MYKGNYKPHTRFGKPVINVILPVPLYEKILAEAKQRNISIAWMVRHLCEASIDGIE